MTSTIEYKTRPIIAITMGDAAGIGPEVVVKALLSKEILEYCRPFVIGETSALQSITNIIGGKVLFHIVTQPDRTNGIPGTIDVLDMHNLTKEHIAHGRISAEYGKAAMEYIAEAARLALKHHVEAVVTAPINKEATAKAGYSDIGHLEYFARLSGVDEYATMLVSGNLRVVHLTTHYSLVEACSRVKKEHIIRWLKLTDKSFRNWGFSNPRIGIAALNPHGGEDGLFGKEEIEEIIPAVKEVAAMGINARGPFPADSIFNRAISGEFDVVLAMYHDQGHIPVKVFGFEKSVSVALGLPFIRTSVDHGTAFDIAGKGIASSKSMEEAIRVAVSLVRQKSLPEQK
jgi:4-phospho-D-threonate 3-dehydrogenase / 4-phospho-D-erythronate 3-dehydrogenase